MPTPYPRLRSLDVIRGIAILGLFPVHVSTFGGPVFTPAPPASDLEKVLSALTMFFFEGKMVSLLGILFRVGMAIQWDHAQAGGYRFGPYYARRMTVLFCLGLAHGILLFAMDVLTSYAVVGLMALLFIGNTVSSRRWMTGLCLAWSYGILLLLVAAVVVFGPFESPAQAPVATGATSAPPTGWEFFFGPNSEVRIFRDGTFKDMVVLRLILLPILGIVFWLVAGWYLLACTLIGIGLARRGLFHDPSAPGQVTFQRRWMIWGLILGGGIHAAVLVAYWRQPVGIGDMGLTMFGALPLALFYVMILLRWTQTSHARWLQDRLGEIGRMALSNYMLQSLLGGLIFYSYGLGWYGSLTALSSTLIVISVWLIAAVFSWLWLRRFRMGPAEWLWRKLAPEGRRVESNPSMAKESLPA